MTRIKLAVNVSFWVASFTITSAATSSASAQIISCSSSTTCSIPNMPMINQNDPALLGKWASTSGGTTTMLCAPTSVAIALSSLTDAGYTVNAGTVNAQFKAMDKFQRADYMAQLMGTTATGGTYWSSMGNVYTARAPEFSPAFAFAWTKNSTTVTTGASQILGDLQKGYVPTIQHGHFDTTCTPLASGELSCTYARNGGHAMAVQAVNGNTVTFNDPWYAVLRNFTVTTLPSKNSSGAPLIHVLPSNFALATAQQFRWTGTYAALMEGIVSVGGTSTLATAPAPAPAPTTDTTAPSTSVLSPSGGSRVAVRSTVSINASANDNVGVSKVEFYVNGTLKCTTSSTYSCAWKVPRTRGIVHKIQTKAYDSAGLSSWSPVVSVSSY